MDFEEARQEYKQIKTPPELSHRLERAIAEGNRRKRRRQISRSVLPLAASILLVFTTALNASPAFAASLQEVPVLGLLAQVLVFDQYQDSNEERILNVTIPQIANTGSDDLENRINQEIRQRINQVVEEAEQRAREYREAYLATGGAEEDAWAMQIQVDYEVKCSTPQYLSFTVWKSESLASVYYEQYFYNIDLETGKELTLRDLLGPNYVEIVSSQVIAQIEERCAKGEIFFGYGEDQSTIPGFQTIDANQKFYLDEDGGIVVVFDKYAIAPGYMGCPEFQITQP